MAEILLNLSAGRLARDSRGTALSVICCSETSDVALTIVHTEAQVMPDYSGGCFQ